MSPHCPPEVQLERLLDDSLETIEASALARHVESCAACQARLEQFLAGSPSSLGPAQTTSEMDDALLIRLKRKPQSLRTPPPNSLHQGAAMMTVCCPSCQKKLAIKDQWVGKRVACPGCGQIIAAPTPVAAGPVVSITDHTFPSESAAAAGGRRLEGEGWRVKGEDNLHPPRSTLHPPPSAAVQLSAPSTSSCSGTFDATIDIPRPDSGHDPSLTDFLAAPQAPDELGRLGKYRILKVLGFGGMGVVYKAEDPLLKRLVALKAMLPALAASASAGKRFLREAQAMAAVEHDHVVGVHDVGEERGVPFLAMEFLKGEPLNARLERDKNLPILEVVRIGKEIAAGLGAAHEQGLIHRDIKPANIWLEARSSPLSPGGRGVGGEGGKVKILDFGLARSAAQDSGLTQQGAIIGTPSHMAPEQARGEPVDARSDLFSLGVILYRLCCGQPAFHGKDTISTLLAVARHEPPPPLQANPEVPAELSRLVMQLLHKEPEGRPPSAAVVVEVLEALHQRLLQDQKPSEPTVPLRSASTKADAPKKRRRLPLLVGALVLLAALVGLGLWASGVIRFQTEQGELVLETNDPEFAFSVVKGGGITLKDNKTHKTYHVKAVPQGKDEYELEVTDAAADLAFKTRTFTIKRGDKVALKAWFERKGAAQPTVEVAPPGPTGHDAWIKASAFLPPDQQRASVGAKLKEQLPRFDEAFVKALPSMAADRQTILVEVWLKARKPVLAGLEEAWLKALPALPAGAQMALADAWLKERKPAFAGLEEAWIKALSALPVDTQVVLVAAWLRECNPAFAGSVIHKSEGSVVTSLEVPGPSVQDLTPLRALTGLKTLVCRSTVGWDNKAASDEPVLRSLKALEKINGKPVAQFWKEALARQANFKEWLRLVPALAAKEQVAAVVAKLKEHNPDWAGEVGDKIDNGVVTQIRVNGKLADLSPVRALPGLKSFHAHGRDRAGGYISDLTPLAGMKKLTDLYVAKMPVRDLSPLKGLKLTTLTLQGAAVSDLSALAGMPLTSLTLKGCSRVQDLSPLKGLPLTLLSLEACGGIWDLSPLKGIKLTNISLPGTTVSDLSALAGMPLTQLEIHHTQVTDLTPLKDMKLTSLDLRSTKVVDLTPLKGMPLTHLNCAMTAVSDLTPLKGMRLTQLRMDNPTVTDLSPLQGMQLETIHLTLHNITEGLDILRNMKSVKTIGVPWAAWPAAEFWARYDKGEFTKAAMAERRAAEYVLSIGGRVHVDVNGKDRDVRALANLPQGAFRLTNVWLLNNTRITDATLAPFADCTNVTQLNVAGTQVTYAGLTHFKDCKGLTELVLENVKVTDAGLAIFKDCNLTNLNLINTQVTDAGLAYLKDFKNLRQLDLVNNSVTDAALAHVKDCKDLRLLRLANTKVSAAGIETLKKALPKCKIQWNGGVIDPVAFDADRGAAEYVLSIGGAVHVNVDGKASIRADAELPQGGIRLTHVYLNKNKQVTDAGLAAFDNCTNVTQLHLYDCSQVTDAGLAHFKDCKEMTLLLLETVRVTDSGLANFKNCKNLQDLRLGNAKVTDAGLAYLKDCKNLTNLDLSRTAITDAGLAHVKDWKELTSLKLEGTKASDVGLAHVKDCNNLKYLNVQKTKVSAAGIEMLQKALPKCKIEWNGGEGDGT